MHASKVRASVCLQEGFRVPQSEGFRVPPSEGFQYAFIVGLSTLLPNEADEFIVLQTPLLTGQVRMDAFIVLPAPMDGRFYSAPSTWALL